MKIQLYGTVLVTTINAPKTIETYGIGNQGSPMTPPFLERLVV